MHNTLRKDIVISFYIMLVPPDTVTWNQDNCWNMFAKNSGQTLSPWQQSQSFARLLFTDDLSSYKRMMYSHLFKSSGMKMFVTKSSLHLFKDHAWYHHSEMKWWWEMFIYLWDHSLIQASWSGQDIVNSQEKKMWWFSHLASQQIWPWYKGYHSGKTGVLDSLFQLYKRSTQVFDITGTRCNVHIVHTFTRGSLSTQVWEQTDDPVWEVR